MERVVQARLDAETEKALDRLVSQLGWKPSRVVREGLRLLAAAQPGSERRTIAGMGKFSSKVSDLGSNKKHLAGFGS